MSVSTNPSGDLHLGSEVALTCQVSGLDTAPAVHWKGPDGKLNSGSLKSVARSDAGTWKCEFSHGGQTYSESIDIKVTGRTLASEIKMFAYDFYHNKSNVCGHCRRYDVLCFCFQILLLLHLHHLRQALPKAHQAPIRQPAPTVRTTCVCVCVCVNLLTMSDSSLDDSLID